MSSRWILGAGAAAVVALAVGVPARASSVAATTINFQAAVARSARIVVGRVTNVVPFDFQGKKFSNVEIAVDKTLKGAPGPGGETLRVFDPGQWYQHSHEAAIKGGVVSYEDPRYATPVPARDIKKGATFVFFLRADPIPAGFPANAAFSLCQGAVDRASRAKDVVALAAAP